MENQRYFENRQDLGAAVGWEMRRKQKKGRCFQGRKRGSSRKEGGNGMTEHAPTHTHCFPSARKISLAKIGLVVLST